MRDELQISIVPEMMADHKTQWNNGSPVVTFLTYLNSQLQNGSQLALQTTHLVKVSNDLTELCAYSMLGGPP